jgi:flavin-dependent dehydrogenase
MNEIVVAGGGLSGAAAAAQLARAGARVLVLERERGPRDKICGEFLAPQAQARLHALGLDPQGLGASRVSCVRFVAGTRTVEAALPFLALGLSRRRLDEALLSHAARLGARIERGVAVRSVTPEGLDTSGGSLPAAAVLLASGKHDVKGARRPSPEPADEMIGFKTYFRTPRRVRADMDGAVEVVLFEGGYAGLQLVEAGLMNLCLLVSRSQFETAGRFWHGLLARLMDEPHLERRLADAEEFLPRPLTISSPPYGYVCRNGDARPGLYRLGDQAAVIPSFAGEGMSIALHSARLAARAVLEGADAAAYHARLARDVSRQVGLATWLQRRIEAWPGRHAAVFAMGLMPGMVGRLASWTRLSGQALLAA